MLERADFPLLSDMAVRGEEGAPLKQLVSKILLRMNPNPAGQKLLNVPRIGGKALAFPPCRFLTDADGDGLLRRHSCAVSAHENFGTGIAEPKILEIDLLGQPRGGHHTPGQAAVNQT